MNFQGLKALAMQTSSASISDAMWADKHRHYMRDVHCQTPDQVLFAQAVTLRSLPYRPDFVADMSAARGGDRSQMPFEQALDLTTEGKVLVVDTSGYKNAAIGGDVKFSRLVKTGAEGIVTDGSIRDKTDMTSFGYSVYCHGWTPRSGTSVYIYGADVNVPVTCGEALVRPNDYIFGDIDGVVVIPESQIEQVLKKAVSKEELDVFVRNLLKTEDINPGEVYPINDKLRQMFADHKGISVEDIAW